MPRPTLFRADDTLSNVNLNIPTSLKKKLKADGLNLSEFLREKLAEHYGNGHAEQTLKELEERGRDLLNQAATLRSEIESKERVQRASLERELEQKNLITHYNSLKEQDRELLKEAEKRAHAQNKTLPRWHDIDRRELYRAILEKYEQLREERRKSDV